MDTLSCSPVSFMALGIDFSLMSHEQLSSPKDNATHTAISRLRLADICIIPGGRTLLCDLSSRMPRTVVPPATRRHVFDLLHGLSHPSVRAYQRLVGDRFVWFGMRQDIAVWVKTCNLCQLNKVVKHHHSPTLEIPVPGEPFSHSHVDFVGPLSPFHGFNHLFTIINRSTRWPEAIPMNMTTAESCADALLLHWISCFWHPPPPDD